MNIDGVVPHRYIVSPTLKEINQQDLDGYDAVAEEGMLNELSNENDRVNGSESYYNYIFGNSPTADINIGGTEGFMDHVKKSASKMIQMVKDFFKWIWSFFGSKQKKAEVRTERLSQGLKSGSVRDDDIKYPTTVASVYPRNDRPVNNLNWIKDTIGRIDSSIDRVETYATELSDFLKGLKAKYEGNNASKDVVNASDEFETKVGKIFSLDNNKTGTLVIPNDIVLVKGVFKYTPNLAHKKNFAGATFKTSLTQIQGYEKDSKATQKKLKDMTIHIQKVEDVMMDVLKNVMASRSSALVNETIRHAMANIRILETTLYRADSMLMDIYLTAIK